MIAWIHLVLDTFLYNNLISSLGRSKPIADKTKKKIFIDNLEFIKNLLGGDKSISSQRKEYIEKFGNISLPVYISYCREYLHNEYEDCLMRNTIRNNMSHLAFYLASSDSGEKKSSVIYNYMLDNGWLNTSTKGSLVVSYEFFKSWVEDSFAKYGFSDIIELDNPNDIGIYMVKKEIKSKLNEAVSDELSVDNDDAIADNKTANAIDKKNSREKKRGIKIKLEDGSCGEYGEVFLRNYYIEREHSRIKHDIIEANSYYISNVFQNKIYNFELIKKRLESEQLLENYSLIIHDDGINSGNHYLYRYIGKEFVLIGEPRGMGIAATNEIFVAAARKRLIDFVNDFVPEAVRRK